MRIFRPPHNLSALRTAAPRPEWRAAVRARLAAYVAQRPAVAFPHSQAVPQRRYLLQPRFVAAGVFTVLLLSATGVAAQQSLPSDVLYPVKIAGEKIQLALSPSLRARATLRLSFAQNRLTEATALAERGSSASDVAGTFAKYEDEVHAVATLVPLTTSANDEFLQAVRSQLTAQQDQLRQVVNPPVDASGTGQGRRVPEAVKIRALKALKVSSEGEEATLPPGAPEPTGLVPAAPTPTTAAAVAPAAEGTPFPLLTAPAERAHGRGRARGAAGISGEDVSKKLKQAGDQLVTLLSQLGQPSAAVPADEVVSKVAQAQAAFDQAQGDFTAASDSGEYVGAYRRALKAYQSTLEATLEFEARAHSSRDAGGGDRDSGD